jgi:hypothetical protein
MDLTSKIRRNPEVVARGLAEGDGGVLLHLDSGAYHGINPVGLAIWELVDGDRTVADLIAAVRAQIRNPPPELERDVIGFLDRALERDLVLVVD